MSHAACIDCGDLIVRPSGTRGRPRIRCATCAPPTYVKVPRPLLTCPVCEQQFTGGNRSAVYCSDLCCRRATNPPTTCITCVTCGQDAPAQLPTQLYCPPCREMRDRDYHISYKARQLGLESADVSIALVFERDGWICQLCHEPVDRALRWPHTRSATLDHRIALANGGAHVEANVQLAHLDCNSRKGNAEVGAPKILELASS